MVTGHHTTRVTAGESHSSFSDQNSIHDTQENICELVSAQTPHQPSFSNSQRPTQSERAKDDEENFTGMVKEALKIIVKTERTFRVGKKDDSKPRLLVVTLGNTGDKSEILRSAASLRDTEWGRVYITPDLTRKEREKGRQLQSELARRREAGEEHIWIRQGRIVPILVDKRQQQTLDSHQKTGKHAPPITSMRPSGKPSHPAVILTK